MSFVSAVSQEVGTVQYILFSALHLSAWMSYVVRLGHHCIHPLQHLA